MSSLSDALSFLSPAAVAALKQVVDEKVDEKIRLALERDAESTASSPYLSVVEASDYLRCNRQRVYDLLSSGRLTRYKDGSRVLIRRDEVEAYLAGGLDVVY